MQYQKGRPGRIIIARFGDGEDILKGLKDISQKEEIRAGIVYLLGGMRHGQVVVGSQNDKIPPDPVWRRLNEGHEMMGIGTIFWQDDEPMIHLHGAFGKKDLVTVGCLRGETGAFIIVEAIIVEIEGTTAVRRIDPSSGMSLLNLVDKGEER